MRSKHKLLPALDAVLLERDEHGFVLHVDSAQNGDVTLRLSPVVVRAFAELLDRAMKFQEELTKLDPHIARVFPFEFAQEILQGRAEFKSLDASALFGFAAQGMFGAIEETKES